MKIRVSCGDVKSSKNEVNFLTFDQIRKGNAIIFQNFPTTMKTELGLQINVRFYKNCSCEGVLMKIIGSGILD